MSTIAPYDVVGLFNKAYVKVANINKGQAGLRATGIYPINPNAFTDQDCLVASLMVQEQITQDEGQNVPNSRYAVLSYGLDLSFSRSIR